MIDFEKLREPFPASDIEWRIGQKGVNNKGEPWAKVLAYVTNRAIMQRLDDVVGPQNWKNEFAPAPQGGTMCGIYLRMDDGEWLPKWDGSDNSQIEAVKGGLSGAMKRSAVHWGIGRYLYDLEEGWAQISEKGKYYVGKDQKNGTPAFRWDPPPLPPWALPPNQGQKRADAPKQHAAQSSESVSVEIVEKELRICANTRELVAVYAKHKDYISSLFDEDKAKLRKVYEEMQHKFKPAAA